ncbi:MAG: TetR/AcrR family transcriptional regulator [Clostridia bacterium]|nr:TetR/AcrR family transcriptional regulator [Clostridia bacterium]
MLTEVNLGLARTRRIHYLKDPLKYERATMTLIDDEMSKRIIDTAESLVTQHGVHNVTVRSLLQEMDITNRVFYNRFHNIREVLEIVYNNTIKKIRKIIDESFEGTDEDEFFEKVTDIVEKSLLMSYDEKMQFNQYVFETDSVSVSNYVWWQTQIKRLIDYAKEKKYIKDVDTTIMSYSIWCFCRGFNADAVGRNMPKSEAARYFRYSIGVLLDGMRTKKSD